MLQGIGKMNTGEKSHTQRVQAAGSLDTRHGYKRTKASMGIALEADAAPWEPNTLDVVVGIKLFIPDLQRVIKALIPPEYSTGHVCQAEFRE